MPIDPIKPGTKPPDEINVVVEILKEVYLIPGIISLTRSRF